MNQFLSYDDLYRLSEELQQLRETQLQSVHCLSETRYVLGFRLQGVTRSMVIDLTPSQPFIVSISSTKIRGPKVVTPVLNFLKAHYVGAFLENIEIAQKPNRTLKMLFRNAEALSEMTFKCFPHGQHLVLLSQDKFVNYPLRPKVQDPEVVTFIETEKQLGWEFNDFLAQKLGLTINTPAAPKMTGEGDSLSYKAKLIKKLEKSIGSLDQGVQKSKGDDEEKIRELQMEAEELQSLRQTDGAQIQGVYAEIKKLKRKTLLTATRRNELVTQLEKIQKLPDGVGDQDLPSVQRKKEDKDKGAFSGTRVPLDDRFELWVGRTDWQNDDLLRLAAPHELWLHLRDYPGAHGVIRCPKKSTPTPAQVELSCRIVAILSMKKKKPFTEGERLDFIVTPRKFVKKPKGAPAGRVIVERETVRRVAYKTIKFEVR